MVCKKVFGEKEPLDDKSPTHGICDPCFEEFMVKSEEQQSNYLTGQGGSEGIDIAFQSKNIQPPANKITWQEVEIKI